MHKDNFDKGIDIGITENPLGFIYGKDVFGPTVETGGWMISGLVCWIRNVKDRILSIL